jgi:hypothetical protein
MFIQILGPNDFLEQDADEKAKQTNPLSSPQSEVDGQAPPPTHKGRNRLINPIERGESDPTTIGSGRIRTIAGRRFARARDRAATGAFHSVH